MIVRGLRLRSERTAGEQGFSGTGLAQTNLEQYEFWCRKGGAEPGYETGPGHVSEPEPEFSPDEPVYLPLQQSMVQPSLQQSLHLSVQQEVQQAFFNCEVCAKAETARTTATERTANIRFMRNLLLTLNIRGCAARGH
jgi:hypothetical protein